MRLKEIEQRLNAIKVELETRGAELTAEELEARETEVKELQEERKGILDQQEKRTKLLATLAAGEDPDDGSGNPTPVKVIRTFDGKTEERKEDKYESMEYRKAFMDYVVRRYSNPGRVQTECQYSYNRCRGSNSYKCTQSDHSENGEQRKSTCTRNQNGIQRRCNHSEEYR